MNRERLLCALSPASTPTTETGKTRAQQENRSGLWYRRSRLPLHQEEVVRAVARLENRRIGRNKAAHAIRIVPEELIDFSLAEKDVEKVAGSSLTGCCEVQRRSAVLRGEEHPAYGAEEGQPELLQLDILDSASLVDLKNDAEGSRDVICDELGHRAREKVARIKGIPGERQVGAIPAGRPELAGGVVDGYHTEHVTLASAGTGNRVRKRDRCRRSSRATQQQPNCRKTQ